LAAGDAVCRTGQYHRGGRCGACDWRVSSHKNSEILVALKSRAFCCFHVIADLSPRGKLAGNTALLSFAVPVIT
jgi:hypothetical protein